MREIVKSQQECKIANFLLFNGVEYKYEEPYEIDKSSYKYRQYEPDFSLYQDGKRIYLEHYALIDKEGNVPPFFANESQTLNQAKVNYNNGVKWKRNTHDKNNTVCIETFSYQFDDGSVFEELTKALLNVGFSINPLSETEKWNLIKQTASDEVEGLVNLFNTFLSLYKSSNIEFNLHILTY